MTEISMIDIQTLETTCFIIISARSHALVHTKADTVRFVLIFVSLFKSWDLFTRSYREHPSATVLYAACSHPCYHVCDSFQSFLHCNFPSGSNCPWPPVLSGCVTLRIGTTFQNISHWKLPRNVACQYCYQGLPMRVSQDAKYWMNVITTTAAIFHIYLFVWIYSFLVFIPQETVDCFYNDMIRN